MTSKSFLSMTATRNSKKVWEGNVLASDLVDKKVILVVNGEDTLLTSHDSVSTDITPLPELSSLHDETDRRVALYITYGMKQVLRSIVVHIPRY